MVLPILLSIFAVPLTYAAGLLFGTLFVTFALKSVLQIAFIAVGLLILLNYVKRLPDYKGKKHLVPVMLGIGFLATPILLNYFGHFVGLGSITPIMPSQSVIGSADIAVPGTDVVITNDIGLLIGVAISIALVYTTKGKEILNKIMKKIK